MTHLTDAPRLAAEIEGLDNLADLAITAGRPDLADSYRAHAQLIRTIRDATSALLDPRRGTPLPDPDGTTTTTRPRPRGQIDPRSPRPPNPCQKGTR